MSSHICSSLVPFYKVIKTKLPVMDATLLSYYDDGEVKSKEGFDTAYSLAKAALDSYRAQATKATDYRDKTLIYADAIILEVLSHRLRQVTDRELEYAISDQFRVYSLDLYDSNLTSAIDLSILNYFQDLRSLDVTHNCLTALPTLPQGLQQLWCNNNQLTDFPDLPASINFIDARYNPLTEAAKAKLDQFEKDQKARGIQVVIFYDGKQTI